MGFVRLDEFRERPEREIKKVVCVMPAYNAELTIERTLKSIPEGTVHEFILVDDCSKDNTVEVAKSLGINGDSSTRRTRATAAIRKRATTRR